MSTPGLQPPAHRSRRAALVVLDVISDFRFPGGGRVLSSLARRARKLQNFLARARAASVPVIYVNDNLGQWRSDFPGLQAQVMKRAPAAREVLTLLAPSRYDYVLLKPRHSAFFGSPLEALLENLRVSSLVLTGISTESCVWITACDAHTRGFRLICPLDTMAGLSPSAINATLTGLKQVLGARAPAHASAIRFRHGCIR